MEDKSERHTHDECKCGEYEPASGPVALQESVLPITVVVHNLSCCQRSEGCSDAVGHHHEQSLSRSLDGGFTLLIYKDTSGNVEEVEGNTVDDA